MTTDDITVLVAYASKMGGTKGIADTIGAVLTEAGLTVAVRPAGDVRTVDGYDGIVLGSAIYAGRWRPEAVRVLTLLAARDADLQPVPTWLFQSGPCGEHATDQVPPPRKVAKYAHRIGAAAPVTFGGRLDPATATGFIARRMAAGPLAGDFRDADRIRAFAADVAGRLTATTSAGTQR